MLQRTEVGESKQPSVRCTEETISNMVEEKTMSGPVGPNQCRQSDVLQEQDDSVGMAAAAGRREWMGSQSMCGLGPARTLNTVGCLQGVKPKEMSRSVLVKSLHLLRQYTKNRKNSQIGNYLVS